MAFRRSQLPLMLPLLSAVLAAGCGGATTTTVETVITKQTSTTPAQAPAETQSAETTSPDHTNSTAGEASRTGHSQTVPNEIKVRLDVAEEEVESNNLSYKIVGGGTFGVIVKSNWTVCEMKPSPGTRVAPRSTVRLIVARSCE